MAAKLYVKNKKEIPKEAQEFVENLWDQFYYQFSEGVKNWIDAQKVSYTYQTKTKKMKVIDEDIDTVHFTTIEFYTPEEAILKIELEDYEKLKRSTAHIIMSKDLIPWDQGMVLLFAPKIPLLKKYKKEFEYADFVEASEFFRALWKAVLRR